MDGYVYSPARFRACVPFRIGYAFGDFETSVGRGDDVCREERRAYVGVRIVYRDGEVEELDWGDEAGSAVMAVPQSRGDEYPPPHEYYLPRQEFQFAETDGEYVFQAGCEADPVPVQHGAFTPIV